MFAITGSEKQSDEGEALGAVRSKNILMDSITNPYPSVPIILVTYKCSFLYHY